MKPQAPLSQIAIVTYLQVRYVNGSLPGGGGAAGRPTLRSVIFQNHNFGIIVFSLFYAFTYDVHTRHIILFDKGETNILPIIYNLVGWKIIKLFSFSERH